MGAIFGLLAGPVVGLAYGIVLFMFFPAFWYGPTRPPWSMIAIVFVLRTIPLAARLDRLFRVRARRSVRRRRNPHSAELTVDSDRGRRRRYVSVCERVRVT
jgi:hypothetical protein